MNPTAPPDPAAAAPETPSPTTPDPRTTPTPRVRQNRALVAAAGLLLGVVYLWNSRDLPAGTLDEPGAGVFPWAVGVGLTLTSLVVLLEARLGRADADLAAVETPTTDQVRRAGLLFAGFVVLVALVPAVGVFVAGAAFIAGVARWMSGMRWRRAITVAVIVAGAVYLLFVLYLRVPLPNGIFE